MNIPSSGVHREEFIKQIKCNVQSCKNIDRTSYVSASLTDLAKFLNAAAAEGEHRKVTKLIANGASVHAFGPIGMNPLHLASMNGHIEVCKVLLKLGVVIDGRNKLEKTALHLAAMNGHVEIVRYLLSLGAATDVLDMIKMTPLHWACDRGHIEVAKLLLAYGADPNLLNKFRKSPLKLAIENNHRNIAVFIDEFKNKCSARFSSEGMDDCLDLGDEDHNSSSSSSILSVSDDDEEADDEQPMDDSPNSPLIFREEFTPEAIQEETIECSDTEDIESHLRSKLLSEKSLGSSEKFCDQETVMQEKLLKSVDRLNEIASQNNSEDVNLGDIYESAASELLRAQAALVPLEDPSRMLRRAIYSGQTIQLTEAGERALAMIRPDPFIIPTEYSKKKEKESDTEHKSSSANPNCSAVVLRNNTIPNLFS